MKSKSRIPSLGYLITKIGRMISRDYAVALEPIGLTPLQAGVIMNLANNKVMSQGDLMSAIVADKATMNQILKRLKQLGLISMARDTEDRRYWGIKLTSQALSLVSKINKIDTKISAKHSQLFGRQSQNLRLSLLNYYSKCIIDSLDR